VSRWFLDDLLVRTAKAKGALIREGQAVAELAELKAPVVAGAWGRWGRFDQQLHRGFVRDRAHRNFGFKRHYRASNNDRDCIELYSFRRGYLGVSAIEGGQTNICGLVHASRLTGHKGRWDAFVDTIRAEEPRLDAMYGRHQPAQDGFLSSEPVIFRGRSPVEQGIFMVGDASGIIDPLTGNGMAMAMQSALIAAPFITAAVARPDDRRQIERHYRLRHRAFFAPRIFWSRRVAYFLARPTLLGAALSGLRSGDFGRFLLHRTRADRNDVARLADAWFSIK
jgi:flavin-dependent dehydrogenase